MVSASQNIVRTNLTISYDPTQLTIKAMKIVFVDLDSSTFTARSYDRTGQKIEVYGTSGISTDPYMTISYMSMYSRNYMPGLLSIYDGQFLFGPLSLDIAQALTTKVYYFTSELIFVSYRCPDNFPITDSARQYCYSNC